VTKISTLISLLLCLIAPLFALADAPEKDYTLRLFSFVPNLRLSIKNPTNLTVLTLFIIKAMSISIRASVLTTRAWVFLSLKKASEIRDSATYGKTDYTDFQFYFFGFGLPSDAHTLYLNI
jgi:hypothetical protein